MHFFNDNIVGDGNDYMAAKRESKEVVLVVSKILGNSFDVYDVLFEKRILTMKMKKNDERKMKYKRKRENNEKN